MSKKKCISKKSNGEGSITKRADGRLMARYTYNGKRHTIYGKAGETEAELNKRLCIILLEINADTFVEPNQITLNQYLPDWLRVYMYPTIRRSTYTSYETYVHKHVLPHLGDKKLKDLSKRDFQLFFNEKKTGGRLDGKPGGLSAKTLINIHNMLFEAFANATQGSEPLMRSNPIQGVKLGKNSKKEIEILSKDAQTAIQQAATASADPHAFGVIFALNTGVRIGELLGFKWSDVDYANHTIRVERTVQRISRTIEERKSSGGPLTKIVISDPKSSCSKRTIPLFEKLWDDLMLYREKQQLMGRLAGASYQNQDIIFSNPLGGIIEPRTYEDVFKRITKAASVENAHFHMLRHTFATRALETGMEIKLLSNIMGHSNVAITYDTYVHLTPEFLHEGMGKMDAYYIGGDENIAIAMATKPHHKENVIQFEREKLLAEVE